MATSSPGPIDPESIATREELGADLTALRLRAGLTVRELATRAHLPTATVGGWVTARHLPGPSQHEQFRALLEACGVAPGEHQPWLDAVARVRRSSDGRATRQTGEGRAPYRGLEAFQPEDAALFFGRDAFSSLVLVRLSRLGRQPSDRRTPRILFVVGASGSGKSSVLRAGVYPAVADGALKDPDGVSWQARIITPGANPVDQLRSTLRDVPEPRLVIIDQFEELFTLAGDDGRAEFVAELLAAGDRTVFAAGMRADFFASAARDPSLVPALQDWQLVVPPMSIEELRAVVIGPARARRIAVDDALVETVIADVFPQSAGTLRQNALPLLSHALLAAWQHRRRGPLTLQDYRGTGGIAGAVQQSAEDAYSELDPAGQEVCRRLFLRLITVDEDLLTTRRRVDRAELDDLDVAQVIELFVARRLVTVDDQSVEISHEALLAAWPRLADWIAADHESLRVHRRLTSAANTWQSADFDDHLLLRGPQLGTVEEWAAEADHAADLNRLERDFVQSSLGAREREVRADHRRTAQLRSIVAALAVLLVIAIGTTIYAVHASRVADSQRSDANTERDRALSRQIAIESQRAATTDLALAAQLGVTAVRINSTVDARSALLDAVAGGVVSRVVGPSGPTTVARNHAGTLLAISNAGDGSVALHRTKNGRPGPVIATIPPSSRGAQIFAIAFNPAGDVLALGGLGGVVRLVDLTDPTRPVVTATLPGRLGIGVQGLAFTPSGTDLFAAGAPPGLRRWNVTDPRAPTLLPTPAGGRSLGLVQSVAVSPNGTELVAGTANGALVSWRTAHLDATPTIRQQSASAINFLHYSPDGAHLVVGSKDAKVDVFTVAHGALQAGRPLKTDFTSWANAASFSPDGRQLAVGSADGKIDILDARTMTMSRSITNSSQVTALSYDPTGSLLTAASADGIVRVFPVLGATMSGLGGPVFAIGMSGSGTRIAAGSTSTTGAVSIWSIDQHRVPRFVRTGTVGLPAAFGTPDGTVALSRDDRLVATSNRAGQVLLDRLSPEGVPAPRPVVLDSGTSTIESVAINPAGTMLAAGSDDDRVRLWDIHDPTHPRALPPLPTGGEIANVAFSPDGRFVAGASVDHKVHLWAVNASAARPVAELGGFSNYAWSVAFSPDSKTLAGGGADNSVRLWNISDPAHPRLLGRPFSGPTHYVFSLAFSPDGKTLAGAGGDGSVWTWSIADPAHPVVDTTLRAADPGGGTYTAAFTPDGRFLAAAGSSGDVTFWNTSVKAAMHTVCSLRGTPITRAEWRTNVPGVPYRDPCR
ncbi:MAG TPA: helix-turn-helix domain-containing protein [Jatrophihabitans sp.]|jgi:WD40 repeat protein